MPGRRLLREDDYINSCYNPKHPDMVRRRFVLQERIEAFENADPATKYHQLGQANLERWFDAREITSNFLHVHVMSGDWGEVTHSMTRQYGVCFAVLNMANAFVPGGAYVEGAVAQEENMFRRTDCHFSVGPDEYNANLDQYVPGMTSLLSAEGGKVYLDLTHPRVCIRGPERRFQTHLGYEWLADDAVFPFFELRASAQDLRAGDEFSETDMRKRIAAQLDTLMEKNVRHVVFGAFGCGAFMNPADRVATVYQEEIHKRQGGFDVIAFAIFDAGYGKNNYRPFKQALRA